MTDHTVPVTLTVSRAWYDANVDRIVAVLPTTAHPIPGERILDLALTSIERQGKVRRWRAARATEAQAGENSPVEPSCVENA